MTLLLARIENLHAVADLLPPERFRPLLADILGIYETAVGATQGHVAAWDPSDREGSSALCVWIDGPRNAATDFRLVAQGIQSAIRRALDRHVPTSGPRTRVRVALGRGDCLYTREGGRVTWVVGDAVNRLHAIERGRPEDSDAVLVDSTLAVALGERGGAR